MLRIESDATRNAINGRWSDWLVKMLHRLLHQRRLSFHPCCKRCKRQRLRKTDQFNTGNVEVLAGGRPAALNRESVLLIGIGFKSKPKKSEQRLVWWDVDWVTELIGNWPGLLSVYNPQRNLVRTALIHDQWGVHLNVSRLPKVVKEWVRVPQLLQGFLERNQTSMLGRIRNQVVRTGEMNQRTGKSSLKFVEVAFRSMGAHFLQSLCCPSNSTVRRLAALFSPLAT